MIYRSSIKTKKAPAVEIGSVLIAKPFWEDDKYRRSVILILEHDFHGSTGIILNKRSNLRIHEALPELEITLPLYFGGPFQATTISFLHGDQSLSDATNLGNGLHYGGSYEQLRTLIELKKFNLQDLRFFSGFVKWSPGELESEIRECKWWSSELNAKELFGTSPEELWSNSLINEGHIYGILDTLPDPGSN